MKTFRIIYGFFLLLASPQFAFAYEVATHATISERASRASGLQDFLQALGIGPGDTFAVDEIKEPKFNNGTPAGWIDEGSVREDDTVSESFFRYRNHFFDPLPNAPNGGGYTYGIWKGTPSPAWGLEDSGNCCSGQGHSLKDARGYFLKGLTESDKSAREQNLAKTFRSLGQVLHLIEDAAQPQHTRNDSHGGFFLGPKSLYELYTNENRSTLHYIGYDSVTFTKARDFWHTDDGKGIADYSNRGFVSAGTNFGTNRYPNPDLTLGFGTEEDMTAFCDEHHVSRPKGPDGNLLPCLMTFVHTLVEDHYRPSSPVPENPRTSTYSIYSADLTTYYDKQDYTLNRFTFDEAHKFLIPRAVGYSAGLINYFFRGQIDLVPDPANPAGYLIQNLGDEDLNGTFTLYYDDADGNRQEVPGAKWPVAVAKGQDMPVSAFTLPTDPAPQTSGEYMLVFTGELGEEKPVNGAVGAVVAKKITPASPFLLETSGGTYKSQSLDQGWERLGVEWFGPKWEGQYIKEDLLILDGALFQHVNEVWEWVDLYNSGVTSLGRITYMGGEELLAEGCVGDICGFLYSPDLGATWQLRAHDLDFPINSGLWYIGNGVVLTAGIPYTTGEGWALYKSTDQGGSWVRISPVTGGTNAKDQWVVGTMCWNQVEGAGSVILASGVAYTKEFGSTCGLWKSTDGGNTWRHLSTLADDCYTRVRSVALDPQDKALMVVGPYLNKSIDAGETWEAAETPDGSQAAGVLYLGNNLGVNEAQ